MRKVNPLCHASVLHGVQIRQWVLETQNRYMADTGDGRGFIRHSETVYSTRKEADEILRYVRFKAEDIEAEFDKMTMGQNGDNAFIES